MNACVEARRPGRNYALRIVSTAGISWRFWKVAHLRVATEPTAVLRYPGVDFRANPARAWEVAQREEGPHERTFPQKAAEGEEPPRDRAVWSNGEHGVVEVGVKQLWKHRADLRPRVRVMKA